MYGNDMKCPYCLHSKTKVVDKRDIPEIDATRRRRECLKCGKRFTTYERLELVSLTVIKKDGRRESFDRDKLLTGLLKACEKRPIQRERIEKAVNEVEAELMNYKGKEVPSSKIGELVMGKLRELDKVAYIRFASVYREFTDLRSFESELNRLRKAIESKKAVRKRPRGRR
jgi:transcriptional repressor NrdR